MRRKTSAMDVASLEISDLRLLKKKPSHCHIELTRACYRTTDAEVLEICNKYRWSIISKDDFYLQVKYCKSTRVKQLINNSKYPHRLRMRLLFVRRPCSQAIWASTVSLGVNGHAPTLSPYCRFHYLFSGVRDVGIDVEGLKRFPRLQCRHPLPNFNLVGNPFYYEDICCSIVRRNICCFVDFTYRNRHEKY